MLLWPNGHIVYDLQNIVYIFGLINLLDLLIRIGFIFISNNLFNFVLNFICCYHIKKLVKINM
jgi:hypothetical protein